MAVNCLAPSHYLNQCWLLVNWTSGNIFQWNMNNNLSLLIWENVVAIWTFWFEKMSFAKWRPFCLSLNVLRMHLTIHWSILVHVMACCHQATIHYLNQNWPIFMTLCGVTWLHWVNKLTAHTYSQWNIMTVILLLSFYPSALRAGGVFSSQSGWAGGCQTCGTHILVTAGRIFSIQSSVELSRPLVVHCHGHLPICPIWACPWAKNLSNLAQIGSSLCGMQISETAGWIYPI